MVVVVTIGFVNDVHYVDDSGFNVYHKNRLIKLGFVMINNDKHNYVLCEAYLLSPFQNFCGPSASEIMKNIFSINLGLLILICRLNICEGYKDNKWMVYCTFGMDYLSIWFVFFKLVYCCCFIKLSGKVDLVS